MHLSISINTAEDIGYFSLGVKEVVYINFKFIPQSKLLIIKGRISSICK